MVQELHAPALRSERTGQIGSCSFRPITNTPIASSAKTDAGDERLLPSELVARRACRDDQADVDRKTPA